MSKGTLVKAALAFGALCLVIRFRNEIAGFLAKIPVVNTVAGV